MLYYHHPFTGFHVKNQPEFLQDSADAGPAAVFLGWNAGKVLILAVEDRELTDGLNGPVISLKFEA